MLTEALIDFFKYACKVAIKVLICTFIWNLSIAPALSIATVSGITMFHIWLFVTIIFYDFDIEAVDIDEGEQKK